MKILDIPQSGGCKDFVSYRSPFGLCRRARIVPKNTWSQARERARRDFAVWARAWGGRLTQAQRKAWREAATKVHSAKRLGQSGPLSGQQLFQGISTARCCIGKTPFLLPPEPYAFPPSPCGQLSITNGADGVRLFVAISGPVTEDIMVFGQAPCSQGREKRRNVSYLGLASAAVGGFSEITALYVARYGQPAPGQKVFIVTRQQKDGWEADDRETSEIVPDKPAGQPAAIAEAAESQQAVAPQTPAGSGAAPAGALTLIPLMHKGCTRGEQGANSIPGLGSAQGGELDTPKRKAGMAEFGGNKLGGAGAGGPS